ncbi:16S rRNA (cytidine(1402)-2'-O)-methyltransferase [Fusibacter ferrireducens]|uniref:Ribosomal RNA small subunit methyltransferase I n=1 Tax=Fusibacter ferrireducens TaxID=2785058 RepID=A0ABR9ZS00_9FIRM|nr:16S rRNA (cytidine(1402)-2'-O)-methyltransferase [Fusibacter ferrireducens]MBF4693236.1 16S rRNA (cytidine(1402)-2'-O)-methyltransferase [Fusibacter ferrireducens]
MRGKLYICGTPIGNLEDITYRALRILQTCDVVFAEDTRHSLKLLNHFEIKKPLYSYHEHNKQIKGPEILSKLDAGDMVALVTDAGMPGISDPGHDVIKLCIEQGYEFEIIPGVTAFTTALVGSGLDTSRFIFEGFLDRDKKMRKTYLESIQYEKGTLIFYESPHRIKATLKAIYDVLGNRNSVIARELTKKYEEYKRGPLLTLIKSLEEQEVKGEIVLLIEGSLEEAPKGESVIESLSVEALLNHYIEQGIDKKEAIKRVAREKQVKKSEVYAISIKEPL